MRQHVDLPYVPDSPLTCPIAQSVGYKPKEAVHALAYFYSMGRWLMEDWYTSLDFPIVPGAAITSVPSVERLKKFILEEELWPPGPSWGHHWADLQRLRMQNFDAFGDERIGSLEEFVNATQDAQGTIFQLSVEHFRRAKPRTSGIALCHFIEFFQYELRFNHLVAVLVGQRLDRPPLVNLFPPAGQRRVVDFVVFVLDNRDHRAQNIGY